MAKSLLPLGVQTFSEIREHGLRYVDKTGFAARLVSEGKWYFLSRPRRFGKSLFVDTLKELFAGNERLFRGLAIHEQWDWSVRYPVLRISFGDGEFDEQGEFKREVHDILDEAAIEAGFSSWATRIGSVFRGIGHIIGGDSTQAVATPKARFKRLIRSLSKKFGRPVVVLIDEYDKPILDALDNSILAQKNRKALRNLYAVLKEQDANIHFCFVTGVTRFSQVSLFSGANQLRDITLAPEYSAICGYTESDLDEVFSQEVAGLDRNRIREWYNGYCWRGDEKVYNPFGVLRLLVEREFRAWWYMTGTPAFLVDLMKRREVLPIMLEHMEVTDSSLLVSDVDSISAEALLFQAGYMTISGEKVAGNSSQFTLDYPNREVRQALNESLLSSLFPQTPTALSTNRTNLIQYLEAGDLEKLEDVLHSMFAGIPHQWHARSEAANYEAYYISVVYIYFLGWGLDVQVEDSTSEGRIDLVVMTAANIYLFEFKVVNGRPSGQAIEQLRAKNYADKYRLHGLPIHLVGVEFSKETKNLASFSTELA